MKEQASCPGCGKWNDTVWINHPVFAIGIIDWVQCDCGYLFSPESESEFRKVEK